MNQIQGAWATLSGNEAQPNTSLFTDGGDSAFKSFGFTKTQRMYGFGFCLLAGFAISLLGSILLVLGQVTLGAILYTLGVVTSLIGTGFLVGFVKQLKMMWDPARRYAAAVFILCIALVYVPHPLRSRSRRSRFVFAFAVQIDVLVIVFAILTYLSFAWYSLSYIPYARALAKKMSPF